MFVHSGLEDLYVISVGKGRGQERVSVSCSHGDKLIDKWSGLAKGCQFGKKIFVPNSLLFPFFYKIIGTLHLLNFTIIRKTVKII